MNKVLGGRLIWAVATIGAPEMVPVFLLKDRPLRIAGEILLI
jgi:hypothetical protein